MKPVQCFWTYEAIKLYLRWNVICFWFLYEIFVSGLVVITTQCIQCVDFNGFVNWWYFATNATLITFVQQHSRMLTLISSSKLKHYFTGSIESINQSNHHSHGRSFNKILFKFYVLIRPLIPLVYELWILNKLHFLYRTGSNIYDEQLPYWFWHHLHSITININIGYKI